MPACRSAAQAETPSGLAHAPAQGQAEERQAEEIRGGEIRGEARQARGPRAARSPALARALGGSDDGDSRTADTHRHKGARRHVASRRASGTTTPLPGSTQRRGALRTQPASASSADRPAARSGASARSVASAERTRHVPVCVAAWARHSHAGRAPSSPSRHGRTPACIRGTAHAHSVAPPPVCAPHTRSRAAAPAPPTRGSEHALGHSPGQYRGSAQHASGGTAQSDSGSHPAASPTHPRPRAAATPGASAWSTTQPSREGGRVVRTTSRDMRPGATRRHGACVAPL